MVVEVSQIAFQLVHRNINEAECRGEISPARTTPGPAIANHIAFPSLRPQEKLTLLWQEATSSHYQVHSRNLRLVHRALLRGESTDLICSAHHLLALLLSPSDTGTGRCTRHRTTSTKTSGVRLTGAADDLAIIDLEWISWHCDIPNSNGAVCATGGKNCRLGTERERPDATAAMTTAFLDARALRYVPENDIATAVSTRQDLAIRATLQSTDEIGVASEESYTSPCRHRPHAHTFI